MQRDVLPMPHRPGDGLITNDAKDPATSFPPIEPARTPEEGYHLTEDMTNRAIDWVRPAEGAVPWVQLAIDEAAEDVDHLISPEELLRVAMARQ